jgi:hypothetical protein
MHRCGDVRRLRAGHGTILLNPACSIAFCSDRVSPAFGISRSCAALVVADLHYSLPQLDWLLAAAPEFDVVIFAGDALDIGSSVDFRAQIVVVKKYLSLLSGLTASSSARAITISTERSGGREDCALDRRGPRVRHRLRRRQPDDIGHASLRSVRGGMDRWSGSGSTISFARRPKDG